MIDTGLSGQVAIVTGANNPMGIGAAIARALAKEGVKLLLTYHLHAGPVAAECPPKPGNDLYEYLSAQTPDAVLADIQALGGQAIAMPANLMDAGVVEAIFNRAEAQFGQVDILVNNAAFSQHDSFSNAQHPVTAKSLSDHLMVNVQASALLMQEFLNRYRQRQGQKGCIINLSTDASKAFPDEVSYGASKHAIESLSRSAAIEMGPDGIRVNIISPGPIQTGWIEPDFETFLGQEATPLGRIGYPEDIADVAVFLASEQARWVSGQLIHVGGAHRV